MFPVLCEGESAPPAMLARARSVLPAFRNPQQCRAVNLDLQPELLALRERCIREGKREERIMPVVLMWAVPAVIVIGGVGYWLVHMH